MFLEVIINLQCCVDLIRATVTAKAEDHKQRATSLNTDGRQAREVSDIQITVWREIIL